MKQHFHAPNYILLFTILGIVVFGFIMLSSASSVTAFQEFNDSNALVKKQIVSGIIGLLALLVCLRLDYHIWKKIAFPLLMLSF